MKKLLLLIFILPLLATAQHHKLINIPAFLTEPSKEMSSMAKWKDHVFLIPQYPDRFDNKIYYLDSADIARSITDSTEVPYHAYTIDNIAILTNLPYYEGIEATAIDDAGNIYFSVETTTADDENRPCYIVKGRIDHLQHSIILNKKLQLPRPKNFNNTGFEGLVYMPDKKQLIAFYEYNKEPKNAIAYIFTPQLDKTTKVKFKDPLYFRLTDAAYLGNNKFIATNYNWKGEAERYIGNADYFKACLHMNGKDPRITSFSRLIEITLDKNTLTYKPKATISFFGDNWEGLTTFGKGVLMVVDGKPPGRPCKLQYMEY